MSSPLCRPRKRNRAGYTLIEVMLSVSILVVGATGFTMLQGASSRAIQNAQEHTVALQIMETWVERVRRDASLWTAPGVASMASTTYLQAGSLAWGTWITPPVLTDPNNGVVTSPASDAWGWDRSTIAEARFCVKLNYRVAHWTKDPPPSEDTVRVDVMVWRPRRGAANALTFLQNGGTNCNIDPNLLNDPGIFKALTSTLVRWQ
jgi:prepilin-type N-terminal cleavage/methylation domain-containing protein